MREWGSENKVEPLLQDFLGNTHCLYMKESNFGPFFREWEIVCNFFFFITINYNDDNLTITVIAVKVNKRERVSDI